MHIGMTADRLGFELSVQLTPDFWACEWVREA